MTILSKAPCRVDLAGGTLDIWPLYLYHEGATTVNFAVTRYTRCRIEPKPGKRITFKSIDLRREAAYDSLEALKRDVRPTLPLVTYVARFFAPPAGFHLTTDSEAPAGAGISGSSALIIAVTAAFNRWLDTRYPIEKVRELAQNIEAQIIRVPTGAQDYYPAMYGGVNAIELGPAGIRRFAIPVDAREIESRIVLAYTGVPRNSGINNWEVTKAHIDGVRRVHRNFDLIAQIARDMRAALERADWAEVARLLGEEWSHRRRNAPGITTPLIDRLVRETRLAGARAAKVCGAGGGGCVLFLAEPDARDRVAEVVRRNRAVVLPVKVAPRGVQVGSE